MNRADGYRVHTKDAMYEIVPYIMPLRYDASNYIKVDIDIDKIQDYIRECRRNGIQMSHMAVIIAGYLRLVSQNPCLNRFAVNRAIYSRNHFSVSFVAITPGRESEDTVNKVYFDLDDTVFTVNEKINKAVKESQTPTEQNSMDILAAKLLKIPFLMRFGIGFLKWLDKHFTLPFSVVDASPFHTSLFVTNLASIRTSTVFHHLYAFGTTSVFISMGQPIKKVYTDSNGEVHEKKVMELGCTMDERIASGYYFGRCFKELKRYYLDPKVLEQPPEKVVRDPDIACKNPKWISR